ncbi:hypothetical protein HOC35_00415 [Candidatus Woesearchaeota archaeon]|jgi:hypothetical protein|nr:hypothetical protein [Candidatus Woesearchaeota archaeon]
MQEGFIRDLTESTSHCLEDRILGSHPSSNQVFKDNGILENVIMFPSRVASHLAFKLNHSLEEKQRKYARSDENLKWGGIGISRLILNTINILQSVVFHGTYTTAEIASRLTESAIRGTYRVAKLGVETVYNKVDKKEESGFKKAVNSIKDTYQGLTEKVDNFMSRYRQRKRDKIKKVTGNVFDHVVVSGIVYGLTALTVSMCSEEPTEIQEPTPIVEPARQETRTDSGLGVSDIVEIVRAPYNIEQPAACSPIPDISNNRYSVVASAAFNRVDTEGPNYAFPNIPTCPLPGLTSNPEPGVSRPRWLRNRNKCNQFVGDALIQAGYDVPTNLQRNSITVHYKAIEDFPHELPDPITNEGGYFIRITEFCNIRPGHIMVIDHPREGESTAHGEVISEVDYRTKKIRSYGAHGDGAYIKPFDFFVDATKSPNESFWRLGTDKIYVLQPIKTR